MNAFKILTGKHVRKAPLGIHMSRWERNTRMDLKEIIVDEMSWIFRGGFVDWQYDES